MFEIIATIGTSALLLLIIVMTGAWCVQRWQGGIRPSDAFGFWALLGASLTTVTAGWVIVGIYAFLFAGDFWRGAWSGASAVLWLAYPPFMIWAFKRARREATRVT
jgi:hypothetical protein